MKTIRIDTESMKPVKHDSLFGDIILQFESQGVAFRLIMTELMAADLIGQIAWKLEAADREKAIWDTIDHEYQEEL